ncbi:hypothetical protein HYDPIDRAFT_94603 [Hydnomerulius pinastri MD-312]|uniref:Galactose oxidase n=1 Tax=Hydnomerulius pinastri MD-312 TaxID=994086 RepID=A0A0C9VW12_9AGAM|nr:hypothetical protein HYDPIDRAFT_94603 [Hydnomerulius pinastri MD-312]
MSIRWTLLSSLSSKARSSHCAAVTSAGQLLFYSGELRPRVPVDGSLHVLDLEAASASVEKGSVAKSDSLWRVLSAVSASSSKLTQVPEPRVGASAVYDPQGNNLYVWGGRGGVDMAPLDRYQSGIWKAHFGALGDADKLAWERLECANDDSVEAPALRSYHSSVLAGVRASPASFGDRLIVQCSWCQGKLYIHAGCPASGRLAALHAYDLNTNKWQQCADAPAEPRGGTAIATVALPSSSSVKHEEVIIRFGGFAGYELPKVTDGATLPLDIYTPSNNTWATIYPAADPDHRFPGPRSVHGLIPFSSPASPGSHEVPVALLYHGEGDASALGHAGAGKFWDDAWLLLASPSSSPASADWKWKKLATAGTKPEGRGWFPSTSYVTPEGKTRVVLTGGLLSSNARSEEVWVGDVQL